MKLENQVTNLELSRKLKELGVKQESVCYWMLLENQWNDWHKEWILKYNPYPFVNNDLSKDDGDGYVWLEVISAFTVAELGEMLAERTESLKTRGEKLYNVRCLKSILKNFEEEKTEWFSDKTEANARAKMLIYLIENGLLNPLTGRT